MSDQAAVRLCPACDSPLPAGALFCISCGTRISAATTNLRAASAASPAPAALNPYPPVIELNQHGDVSSAPLSAPPAALPSYQQPGYAVPPYPQQPAYPPHS